MHALLAVPFVAALAIPQDPAPRSAAVILREYGRVAMPSMSDGSDPESVKRFKDAIASACRRQGELAQELFAAHPDHARVPELLDIRWAGLTNALREPDAVIAETQVLLDRDELRDDVRLAAMHARTHAMMQSDQPDELQRLKAVRELIAADQANERTGICLLQLVERHLGDPETMRPLLEVATETWPDSGYVGRPAKRWLAMLDTIGKPFVELLPEALREPFAAAKDDTADFVVVQLWMGWLRDADPEIAALRALREEFGERVQVVGLLNGDAEARLPALRDAGVDWPQLPAPAPMKSPLGVPRLGVYFVLDAEGKVAGFCGRARAAVSRVRQLASAKGGVSR